MRTGMLMLIDGVVELPPTLDGSTYSRPLPEHCITASDVEIDALPSSRENCDPVYHSLSPVRSSSTRLSTSKDRIEL